MKTFSVIIADLNGIPHHFGFLLQAKLKMEDRIDNSASSSKLTIEDLPNELLAKIFKWITDESQMDSVQSVSPRWFSVVDEMIGRVVSSSISMALDPSNPSHRTQGYDLISEIGVHSLHINSYSGSLLEHLPSLKYPYLLKRLHISSPLKADLFRNLTLDAINLSLLDIALPALTLIRSSDLHLDLPLLKELRVRKCFYDDGILALPNLRTLFEKNHLPQLARLIIDVPIEGFWDLATIKVIIPFIQDHPSLEKLNVGMFFPRPFKELDRSSYAEELNAITTRIRDGESCPSLKICEVVGIYKSRPSPHLEIWKEFGRKQKSLHSITLKIGSIPSNFLETICTQNEATLAELAISQNIGRRLVEEHLNCRPFTTLQRLQFLKLAGCREITGTRHLPFTLVILRLTGLMRSEEAEHVLLRLPTLKEISLAKVNDGQEGYGVSLETLQRFVQNRRVLILKLQDYQLEGPYLRDCIPSGDPVNPKSLSVREWNLEWGLDRDGYYVDQLTVRDRAGHQSRRRSAFR